MRITVRATRSYMAGLGTSGSLVAAAALLFVVASAIVAFRGWPQIATGPAKTAVSAAAQPTAPSHAARRLAAVLRRPGVITRASTRRAAGGFRSRAGGSRRRTAVKGTTIGAARPVGSTSGSGSTHGGSSPSGSPGGSSGSGGCGAATCSRPQSIVSHLTNTISRQVMGIGSSVGSGLSSATSAVAAPVGGVSPQAGNATQNDGNTAGNAVSGTATTVGNAVNQVGNTISGGH